MLFHIIRRSAKGAVRTLLRTFTSRSFSTGGDHGVESRRPEVFSHVLSVFRQ